MDPSPDDPVAAVRRLLEARHARDPGDQAARLLLAAVEAAEQLRGVNEAEARRRVDAAVRVLGVLTPAGHAQDPRPHEARTDPAPRPDTAPGQRPGTASGQRPATASEPRPGTASGLRPAAAADQRLPDDAIGPRSRPHARPTTPSDAYRLGGDPGTRGGGKSEEVTRPGGRPEEPGTRGGSPRPGTGGRAPVVSQEPGVRGQRRDGRAPEPRVASALSELARSWAELGRGTLSSEPVELLAELVRTGVPEGADAARFHVALLRAVDLALAAARYLPCEAAIVERARPLLQAAVEGAELCGVRVHPGGGAPKDPPCPVNTAPAFGERVGAVVWVDQHGFALPDGRVEAASVRVAVAPPPSWFEPLTEGYGALVRAAANVPDGLAQVRAYRGWIDELPGLADAERRGTTLRYAASALFAIVELDGQARGAFERLAYALEREGSYVIPLEPTELSDARRYELVLRPGAGPPRILRPGFQGEGVVQQRARILADPAWLGTMSS